MQPVTLQVGSAALLERMVKMRRWLDHHRCHVEDFEYYKLADNIIVIQIGFAEEKDASEFAAEFGGETALCS